MSGTSKQVTVAAARLSPGRLKALLGVVLVGACLLLYAPVRNLGFIDYDDEVYVTANPIVAEGLNVERLSAAFYPYEANWIPLTWISLAADVQLFGFAPGNFHLTNAVLHGLNALMLFVALSLATGSVWRSWWVAALWALHPQRVESVAWIAERKDVLSSLGALAALVAYARYVRSRTRTAYVTAFAAFVLGILAKPMLVTFPLLLLLLDFWPFRRMQWRGWLPAAAAGERMGVLLGEKVPFAVVAVACSVIAGVAQRMGGAVVPLDAISWSDRLTNVPVSCAWYLWRTLWPTRLAIFYPYVRWSLVVALGCAVFLVALSWVAWRWRERFPFLLTGWLWYLIALAPVIGIVQVGEQAYADRYTYLPTVGVLVAAVWLVADLAGSTRRRTAACAAATLALVALLPSTRQQIGYWHDTITLFGRALEVTSDNYKAHLLVGTAWAKRGDDVRAAEHFRAALLLRPTYAPAHLGLGNVALRQDDLDAAARHFDAALASKPGMAAAHNSIGLVRRQRGDYDGAVESFRHAIELQPEYTNAYYNLAGTFTDQGNLSGAIEQYRAVIRLVPNEVEARMGLGLALSHAHDETGAIEQFSVALRLNPLLPEAHYSLALSYAELGRLSEALSALDDTLRLRPDWELAQSLRNAVATGQYTKQP